MEDLFYLNKKELSFAIFSDFVTDQFVGFYEGVQVYRYPDNFQIIFPPDGKILHFDWTLMTLAEFEDETVFLLHNEITFIAMITYHTAELKLILPVIKAILLNFGGMIGNDSDGFLPLFTTKTLSALHDA